MDLWDQSIPPEEVVIFVRDAVEIISYLLSYFIIPMIYYMILLNYVITIMIES